MKKEEKKERRKGKGKDSRTKNAQTGMEGRKPGPLIVQVILIQKQCDPKTDACRLLGL